MLLKNYIEEYNKGIDPKYYEKLSRIESSNNPNAKAKTSSAAGLFQFTEGTWKEMTKSMGVDYSLDDRYNPEKAREVVQEFTNRNRAYLTKTLQRNPNETELYLAHFLGSEGARKMLTSDANTSINDVVGKKQIAANKSIFLNKDGSAKKVGDIYNWAQEKLGTSPSKSTKTLTKKDTNLQGIAGTPTFVGTEGELAGLFADRDKPAPVVTGGEPEKIDFFNFAKIKELEDSRIEKEKSILQQMALQEQQEARQRQAQQQGEQQYEQPQSMDPYNYINIEEYQDGGEVKNKNIITISEDPETFRDIDITSKEYRDMYENDMVYRSDMDTLEPIIDMPEVVVTGKQGPKIKIDEGYLNKEVPDERLQATKIIDSYGGMRQERREGETIAKIDSEIDVLGEVIQRSEQLEDENKRYGEDTYEEPLNKYGENVYKEREKKYEEVKDKYYLNYRKDNRDEVIEIQTSLAENGYNVGKIDGYFGRKTKAAFEQMVDDREANLKTIDKYYNSEDPENIPKIERVQQTLVDRGFLKENEIDGIFGDNTRAAVLEYNKSKGSAFSTESVQAIRKVESEWCARGMADVLESEGVDVEALGVRGVDAWHMQDRMSKREGNTSIYNIYEEYEEEFSKVKTAEDLIRITDKVKKESQTTPEMYKKGDIVGIYHRTSGEMGNKSVLNSKTKNTHVGFVSGFRNGIPIITHNVNGTLHHDPYDKLQTAWINRNENLRQAPVREKDDTDYKAPEKFIQNFQGHLENPLTTDEIGTLDKIYGRTEHNANTLPKELNSDVDPNWLKKATIGVIRLETALGKNAKGSREELDFARRTALDWKEVPDEEVSYGIGKTKLYHIDSFARNYFQVKDISDLNDVNKGVDIVSYTLLKNYDTFKDYGRQFPELGLEEEDFRNMAILAYNQGSSLLLKTGRVVDERTKEEEVEALRSLYKGKVKDISSTNYKYLKRMGLTGLANKLYDRAYPEGHETYIGRVNRYAEELLE